MAQSDIYRVKSFEMIKLKKIVKLRGEIPIIKPFRNI